MAPQNQIHELFLRYLDGKCSPEEIRMLMQYFHDAETPEELRSLIAEELNNGSPAEKQLLEKAKSMTSRVRLRLREHTGNPQRKVRRLWLKRGIAIAAFVVIALAAGLYFYTHKKETETVVFKNDIPPGSNRATLILSGGRKIDLDKAGNGTIAEEGSIKVTKTAGGRISYQETGGMDEKALSFNTILTPRGGQYELLLPDGSHVWLNAASKLVYPVRFGKAERKIQLSGEAYFEIAKAGEKGRNIPFLVESETQTVEVLGTHFNVHAYGDEPQVKTTLLEGSLQVRIPGREDAVILRPGQQAITGKDIQITEANTEEALAWKNGYFYFADEDIHTIMNKISRWYDVEVVYEGNLPREGFWGTVSRFKNVSQVLDKLQLTGRIHFKIEGRRITVMR